VGWATTSSSSHSSAAKARAARTAFPAIIIFEGELLRRRIVVVDRDVNSRLLLGDGELTIGRDVTSHELETRPHFDMWLYWGWHWTVLAKDSAALTNLRESAATQHGRFYPARGASTGLLLLDATGSSGRSLRRETHIVLGLLKNYGIPTGLP
jgi:hypothetical protein